ncbi:MarR family winged helix-turn-helix transcriptional regulator [Clostridium cylindrosporum]|uniref:Putative transcriptional regulator, MarR family n=1 Tax=Clostridium cylindrosporum DSM 605 TaxID=1121307 RepID=A0A0J8DBT0_CLOCY|nr:MarR family winged helix-turn-helix transcriptional regulator [Clostridium cylindrosporum]KMT21748.1 putative transcriptional regulator, MarR family [Clostridium cylindrosporum DSM 605]
MNIPIHNIDLIDLISEKHMSLRKLSEDMWNDESSISITNSEWFIISMAYGSQPTIAEVAHSIDISRQATHKCIKTLKSKGIIEIHNVENNNRDKCLRLTRLGEKYYMKNKMLKETIVKNIADKIGRENMIFLKDLLKQDWI